MGLYVIYKGDIEGSSELATRTSHKLEDSDIYLTVRIALLSRLHGSIIVDFDNENLMKELLRQATEAHRANKELGGIFLSPSLVHLVSTSLDIKMDYPFSQEDLRSLAGKVSSTPEMGMQLPFDVDSLLLVGSFEPNVLDSNSRKKETNETQKNELDSKRKESIKSMVDTQELAMESHSSVDLDEDDNLAARADQHV